MNENTVILASYFINFSIMSANSTIMTSSASRKMVKKSDDDIININKDVVMPLLLGQMHREAKGLSITSIKYQRFPISITGFIGIFTWVAKKLPTWFSKLQKKPPGIASKFPKTSIFIK